MDKWKFFKCNLFAIPDLYAWNNKERTCRNDGRVDGFKVGRTGSTDEQVRVVFVRPRRIIKDDRKTNPGGKKIWHDVYVC